MTAEPPAWAVAEARKLIAARRNGQQPTPEPEDLLAGIRDGSWLCAQTFPPLRYHIPGLVPEGLSVLAGAPKVGKSFLVLDFAIAAASGGTALERIACEPRAVCYFALEDGDRRLQSRVRYLTGDPPRLPADFRYFTTCEPGRLVATLEAYFSRYGGEQPLVLLDTLGKALPPALMGETPYSRDYRIMGELKAITDACPGSALAVLHHDRKAAAEDFISTVSGTNAIAGAADTVLVLSRKRGQDEAILQVTGRDVHEGAYAMTFAAGAWQLDGANLEEAAQVAAERQNVSRLGDRSTEIVATVAAHPAGVDAAVVATAIGIDAKTAGTYLGRLAEKGRIRRAARGLYSPVESVGSVEFPAQAAFNTSNTFHTPQSQMSHPTTTVHGG